MSVQDGREMYDQERGDRRREEREKLREGGSLAEGRELYRREHGDKNRDDK